MITDTTSSDTATTWIRQFSLRWILGLTAVCAVMSLLIASSVRGSRWSIGVVAAVLALVVVMVVHAITFGCIWLLASAATHVRDGNRATVAQRRPDAAVRGDGERNSP